MGKKFRIIVIVAIFLSGIIFMSLNKPYKQRYFLIGYVATYGVNGVWTGGYDTTLNKYPNAYQFVQFFQKKYKLTKCKILAVTEYSNDDRIEFWKNFK